MSADPTVDPSLDSWVEGSRESGRPVQHLPFGVVDTGEGARPAVAIGDQALILNGLIEAGVLSGAADDAALALLMTGTLESFLGHGPSAWRGVRARLVDLLVDRGARDRVEPHLAPLDSCAHLLPIRVGDYVDFYSSRHHAENLGRILRPDGEPLLPNWVHLPVGYHGRAGTVVVSGTDVVRPIGQWRNADGNVDVGPSRRLDIEVELAAVVGTASAHGVPIPIDDAADHLFGVVLMNDWSARDIQAWEYQPLGPHLGKSFATSIAPWITPLDALAPFRLAPPSQDPEPAAYLRTDEPWGFDLELTASLSTGGHPPAHLSTVPFGDMYWTMAQQLAHLTINGASVRPGDLLGSGTVSGPEIDQRGSLMEITWGGRDPVRLADGAERTFLLDGDEVTIAGTATSPDAVPITLSSVRGRIAPSPGIQT